MSPYENKQLGSVCQNRQKRPCNFLMDPHTQ